MVEPLNPPKRKLFAAFVQPGHIFQDLLQLLQAFRRLHFRGIDAGVLAVLQMIEPLPWWMTAGGRRGTIDQFLHNKNVGLKQNTEK